MVCAGLQVRWSKVLAGFGSFGGPAWGRQAPSAKWFLAQAVFWASSRRRRSGSVGWLFGGRLGQKVLGSGGGLASSRRRRKGLGLLALWLWFTGAPASGRPPRPKALGH
jgi:hypothetical protein